MVVTCSPAWSRPGCCQPWLCKLGFIRPEDCPQCQPSRLRWRKETVFGGSKTWASGLHPEHTLPPAWKARFPAASVHHCAAHDLWYIVPKQCSPIPRCVLRLQMTRGCCIVACMQTQSSLSTMAFSPRPLVRCQFSWIIARSSAAGVLDMCTG